MRDIQVAHVLRKYDPQEWGGTETAIHRLLDGLRHLGVDSVVHCPRLDGSRLVDPLADSGYSIRRFNAFVPTWGIPREQRRQLMALGGNIVSWDIFSALQREQGLSIIHSHALRRLGGIALQVARWRQVPLVLTVHGGVLDLDPSVRQSLVAPLKGGLEWGKLVGAMVGSHNLLSEADAVLALNRREATLLQQAYPKQRVLFSPHGVAVEDYERDYREVACQAFPYIRDRKVLLVLGRVDPTKNQSWLVEQAPRICADHPNAIVVFAGAPVATEYAALLKRQVNDLGLEDRVFFTGGLPPLHPTLVGLLQSARALISPSISETFGLVLLEAFASRTPVLASRTTGAAELVDDGHNGLLFDLDRPLTFHRRLQTLLCSEEDRNRVRLAGYETARKDYDATATAARVKALYEELIELKQRRKRSSPTARVFATPSHF